MVIGIAVKTHKCLAHITIIDTSGDKCDRRATDEAIEYGLKLFKYPLTHITI